MYKTHEYFHNAESFDNHLTINGIFETNNKVSETVKREILSRTDLSIYARDFLEKDFAKDKPISVIARTSEKTLMLSNGRVNVNDSYKTTMCSLHALIYNLVVKTPISCSNCNNVIDEAKRVTHDHKHFKFEYECRTCEMAGSLVN